jgi:uncharacterized protein with HEPN domain
MPSKSAEDALDHIRHTIYLARGFIEGLDFAAFKDNALVFYGVTRCLEIVSEASRRLLPEIKARYPDIPWTEIAGAGNVYRHDYEDVEQRLVWGTVTERLPALLVMVEKELSLIGSASTPPKAPGAE